MTEPVAESGDGTAVVEDPSTRTRILAATVEALGRSGHAKLSLKEVAMHAGVSRPTLYRWFASKEELLTAFGLYERDMFANGLARATSGLDRVEKLDAALRFIVEYQQSYSGARLVDVEPEAAVAQLAEVLPVMRAGLQRLISGPNAAVKAAVAVRVAVSQYIVRSDDANQFLAQLRHAVGIKLSGTI
jgi:AcrR family transcriptional regulator